MILRVKYCLNFESDWSECWNYEMFALHQFALHQFLNKIIFNRPNDKIETKFLNNIKIHFKQIGLLDLFSGEP